MRAWRVLRLASAAVILATRGFHSNGEALICEAAGVIFMLKLTLVFV
jgi:hypothetical protein